MSDTPVTPPTGNEKRDELRAKIEASERRNAQRTLADSAREAANAAAGYTRAHPLTVVGGAVAVGVIIGLLTRPGRRIARNTAAGAASAVSNTAQGAGRAVSGAAKKRIAPIGTLLADAAVAYGIKLIDGAMDRARTGQDALEDVSDSARAKARELRREANYVVGSAADKSRTVSRKATRKASRAVRDLKGKVAR